MCTNTRILKTQFTIIGEVSTRLLLELDCCCLPNIVNEDILGHKILLLRTFSATSNFLPSIFSATSNLLPSTFVATNKIQLVAVKVLSNKQLVAEKEKF